MPNQLADLQQKLLQELGLQSLPAQQQQEMLAKIGEMLFNRVITRAMEKLTDKDKDELAEVLEKNTANPGALYEFLDKRIAGLDELVAGEAAGLRQELAILNSSPTK